MGGGGYSNENSSAASQTSNVSSSNYVNQGNINFNAKSPLDSNMMFLVGGGILALVVVFMTAKKGGK
jgi:hypothetical protein